jgi:methylphosphotriester-DNA--protein-cysteine methyltransferase
MDDIPYIADMKTVIVHLKTCPLVPSIEEKDILRYTSTRLAKMAGYAPCKMCNPDKK